MKEKPVINDSKRCVNCFGYAANKCTVLTEWYNTGSHNCMLLNGECRVPKVCPFFKARKDFAVDKLKYPYKKPEA